MKIVFMGTPAPAVPTLEAIVAAGHEVVEVWTQPDRRSGRGKKLTAPPVKSAALKHGIDVFQPEKIRNKETRKRFASLGADVAVVVAYGQILTKTYLNAFEHGCINVHFSLLPAYRGAAPVNWAIANGEKVTGVTTMKMDRGLDTGDILKVSEVRIEENENSIELMGRLADVGSSLLIDTLEDIDTIVPIEQSDEEASYAPLFSKSDGLVDWTRDSSEIRNRVRGFQPFPGSYSFLDGKTRAIIWDAQIHSESDKSHNPGEVFGFDDGYPLVVCGSGALKILEAQIAGKPRQSAKQLVESDRIRVGTIFGEQSE